MSEDTFYTDRINNMIDGDFDSFEDSFKSHIGDVINKHKEEYQSSGNAFSDYINREIKEGVKELDEDGIADLSLDLFGKFGNDDIRISDEIKEYNKDTKEKIISNIDKL